MHGTSALARASSRPKSGALCSQRSRCGYRPGLCASAMSDAQERAEDDRSGRFARLQQPDDERRRTGVEDDAPLLVQPRRDERGERSQRHAASPAARRAANARAPATFVCVENTARRSATRRMRSAYAGCGRSSTMSSRHGDQRSDERIARRPRACRRGVAQQLGRCANARARVDVPERGTIGDVAPEVALVERDGSCGTNAAMRLQWTDCTRGS